MTKNHLFGWFWTGIWKKYCHIWNHHPWICLEARFSTELKILKFCTKSAWIRYFWGGISNQQLEVFSIANFPEKMRLPKLETKEYLISVFQCCDLKKKYFHIWNQRPWICLCAKLGAKIKIFKIGIKNVWFHYFWARISK